MDSDIRQERGLALAREHGARIRQIEGEGDLWFVPSERGRGGYVVNMAGNAGKGARCSCQDGQRGGAKCKHVWAVECIRGDNRPAPTAKAMPKSDLTADEQRNVRTAMAFLRARYGSLEALAEATRASRKTLMFMVSRRPPDGGLAVRLARLAGVPTDDVIQGRYPPPGACPHCGNMPAPLALPPAR